MRRLATLPFLLLALTATAQAQMWSFTDETPRPPEKGSGAPKDAAIPPLSPNTIVGRVQWVDASGSLAVILIDRGVVYADSTLVSREDDCTPRAMLRPIKLEKPSLAVACRVTHGTARAGEEIVMPGAELKKSASATLKPREAPAKPPGATVTPTPGNPPPRAGDR